MSKLDVYTWYHITVYKQRIIIDNKYYAIKKIVTDRWKHSCDHNETYTNESITPISTVIWGGSAD